MYWPLDELQQATESALRERELRHPVPRYRAEWYATRGHASPLGSAAHRFGACLVSAGMWLQARTAPVTAPEP
jgi:hypothetical protein